MLFEYFAGAIFTPQQIILFYVVAGIIAGLVISLPVCVGWLLFNKFTKRETNLRRVLLTSVLIGFALALLAALVLIVAPTRIKDYTWQQKQEHCAQQAGYRSPADDASPATSTAESQAAYRDCLQLDW